ncbi:phospholipase A1-IIgamma-like [Mangifera indica]|uniref:phospholipase A1-IIgamma-like n=1 Tax=Mangifera indica TaxID=29780 RepID=UPI001CFB856E|nr:phospholipase A1-IIgamma-like [Mangifera indica]
MALCKVPDNLEVILSYADSTDIVDCLHAGVFLKGRKEKFWFDKTSGSNAFMLFARDFSITRGNDQRYWKWTSIIDENGGVEVEVVEAVEINWLEVKIDFPIKMLTPRTSYKVSFILMKKEDNKGFDKPVKLKLLLPNQEPVERTQDLSSMSINEWTEIPVGDFITPCDHTSGDIEISMAQIGSKYMTKGLVINKILICPVTKDWKELSGENNWDGLLDPLNVDLSKFITVYGERLDAIYDCIITDETSPEYELPMYKKKEFFSKVGPDKGKARQIYEVKKYIYTWDNVSFPVKLLFPNRSAWIGYVAVATDEGTRLLGRRDILVCWRGTYNNTEWEKNTSFSQTHAEVIYPTVPEAIDSTVPEAEVHNEFYSIYTMPNSRYGNKSARNQVVDEVKNLVNLYQDEEVSITITGHGVGAGLATLNAADIVSNKYNKPDHNPEDKEFLVTTFVFGSPKVGDIAFQTEFNKHILERKLRLLRIENVEDLITMMPLGNYVKVGNEITFTQTSASSDEYDKIKSVHSLKNYIKEICALPYSSREASYIPSFEEESGWGFS